jgi:hypothetical protein
MSQKHTLLMRGSPCVPRTLKMHFKRIKELTFVEFCVDGINLNDSLGGLGRDSNPDPSAMKPLLNGILKIIQILIEKL